MEDFAWCGGRVFFFNDTATTEIFTLSLHDALPIYTTATTFSWEEYFLLKSSISLLASPSISKLTGIILPSSCSITTDRKSTRLNSSHANISYAVFCLKKNIAPSHFRFYLQDQPLTS